MADTTDSAAAEPNFDPNDPQAIQHANPLAAVTGRVNLWATYIGSVVAIIAISVIGVMLVISVVLRFVFNTSLGYAVEIPTFTFPWLVAGGVVAAMGAGGHLAVDYFANMLPGKGRRWLDVFVWGVSTAVLAYLTYLSTFMIRPFSTQASPIIGLPMLLSYAAYIYMAASLTIQAGARLASALRGRPLTHQEALNV